MPKSFDDPRAPRRVPPRARSRASRTCPSRRRPPAPARSARRATDRERVTAGRPRTPRRPPARSRRPQPRRSACSPTRRARRNREVAEETGQLLDQAGFEVFKVYFSKALRLKPSEVKLKTLKKGSRVIGGTVLGRVGKVDDGPGLQARPAPQLLDPARRPRRAADRPEADPRRLEAARGHRDLPRRRQEPVRRRNPGVGQVLLMSKEALARRVLANQDIDIYACGRDDIRSGQVDRRVLATLEFLAASGLRPTVTSLKCGHGFYTASGNVSAPLLGQRGRHRDDQRHADPRPPGQGLDHRDDRPQAADAPGRDAAAQIISLMDMGGPTGRDGRPRRPHPRRLPAAVRPQREARPRSARRLLSNNQWDRFVDRLTDIENPVVRTKPSKYSIKVKRPRASTALERRPAGRLAGHVRTRAALPVLPARLPVPARARLTAAT